MRAGLRLLGFAERLLRTWAAVVRILLVVPALQPLFHQLLELLPLLGREHFTDLFPRLSHLPPDLRVNLLADFLDAFLSLGHDLFDAFTLLRGQAEFSVEQNHKFPAHELGGRVALTWHPLSVAGRIEVVVLGIDGVLHGLLLLLHERPLAHLAKPE